MQERTLGVTVISPEMLAQGSAMVRKANREWEIIREQKWSRSTVLPLCRAVTTRVLNLVYQFWWPYFRKNMVELQSCTDKLLFAHLISWISRILACIQKLLFSLSENGLEFIFHMWSFRQVSSGFRFSWLHYISSGLWIIAFYQSLPLCN